MKKLTKTLFTLGLLVTLAACGGTSSSETPSSSQAPSSSEIVSSEPISSSEPVVTHLVTFYKDSLGGIHTTQTVNHGEKATRPATDPVREGYTFVDWYADFEYKTLYDFDLAIMADTEIFAKMSKDYTPDTREFVLIGKFENTAHPDEWDVNSRDTLMTIADDKNLFSITIELGYKAAFKVKLFENKWGLEYGYDFIDEPDTELLSRAGLGSGDIIINKSGEFTITFESDLEVVTVTRNGDATGEGVKPDPDPSAKFDVFLVGDMNGWAGTQLEYVDDGSEVFWLKNTYIKEGEVFRFRKDADWSSTWGFTHAVFDTSATDTLDAHANDNNFIASENGIYSFKLSPVTTPTATYKIDVYYNGFADGFEVMGSFAASDWATGAAMVKVETPAPLAVSEETSEEPVDPNPIPTDLHYRTAAITFAENNEYKVKAMLTWEISWGTATGGNFKATSAGSFMVDVVFTVTETRAVTAVVTLVPVS